MRFAICDDNKEHINTLISVFDRRRDLNIEVEPYENGEELVRDYKNNGRRYDALFIDMEMEGMNGIETANLIREMDDRVIIVFVTSYEQYAIESIQCEPIDYIIKAKMESKVNNVVDVIQKKISKKKQTISFYSGNEYLRLYGDEIIYCKSDHNDIIIYTKDETFQIRMSLSELEKRFDPDMFCRVHRSYIVNLGYISRCEKNEIHLYHSDDAIPLSRQAKKRFTEALVTFEQRGEY